ncbi:MAG TPA: glycoside hydrolase family 38 C-terminal domain-containing protein [bacterium]|nr:glycoside hydrolase family 38 C-terminal domain-containing protein [bacterium]
MTRSFTLHVISNTHWDREWRYSFQQTRMMLVDMMDKTLSLLENDVGFKFFHLDSQTSLLEDYLQIRPEGEKRIQKLVQAGRLFIGPWYCLPDQFMVSGESLVRNLLLGHRIAGRFGPVLKVGYSPFSWGQISQLPQLYAGFGIDTALFYRGVSKTDTGKAEFIWEGADDTRVLASRFSKLPRCNFWYEIYRPVIFNRQGGVDDREFHWESPGCPVRFCDPIHYRRDYKLADPPDEYHWDRLQGALQQLKQAGEDDFSTSHLFWAQGHDNSAPSHRESQLIEDAQALLPHDVIRHSSLPDYVACLKKEVKDLKVLKGEMRSVKKDRMSSSLAGGVLSARTFIKQANFDAESLLLYYAEPFAAFHWLHGREYPEGFLSLAWRYLLDNHGHDSIGGCSVDAVHDDMLFRFNQAREIARGLVEKNGLALAAQIDLADTASGEIPLILINPGNSCRSEILTAYVDVPQEWSGAYAIDPVPLTLLMENETGEEIPVQQLSMTPELPVLQQPIDSPLFLRMNRHLICFPSGEVPGYGYRCLKLRATAAAHRCLGSLSPHPLVMENAFLRVAIQPNGTWNLYDKLRSREYRDLGYVWDRGEVGDPWTYQAPAPDQIFTSLGNSARICLEADGPFLCRYGIYLDMDLPESAAENGRGRSSRTGRLSIKHSLTLTALAERLDLITEIDNRCEDHWLRLMFPTDLGVSSVAVDGQFDVITRRIHRNSDAATWPEAPQHPQPMNSFVDYSDGQCGLAFINQGLKEYEALDDARRTFAMTLIRCFPLKIGGVGLQDYSKEQKGSQCLGRSVFHYALYPHAGDWEQGRVFAQTEAHNRPLNILQAAKNRGSWPKRHSFLQLEPEVLQITAVKKAEQGDTLIVRFYNPTDRTVAGMLNIAQPVHSARYLTLEEKPVSTDLEVVEGDQASKIPVQAGAKKIVTLELVWRP